MHGSEQNTATNRLRIVSYTFFSFSDNLLKSGIFVVGVKALWDSILESSNIAFESLNITGNPFPFNAEMIDFTFHFSAVAIYSVFVLGYVTYPAS